MKTKKHTERDIQRPKVLGTGLIALDIVMNTTQDNTPFIGVGGTCGNVLTILSLLGWDSYPIARLNECPAATRIQEDFKTWNVHLDFARSAPQTDPPVIIHSIRKDRHGQPYHRFSFNCPTCGSWLPNFKPIVASTANEVTSSANDSCVFFFDRASRASINIAKACVEKGTVVVFEPISASDKRLFAEAVATCHILKYSDERLGQSPVEAMGLKRPILEIQTQGPSGLKFRFQAKKNSSDAWQQLAPIPVAKLLDCAGAGDWCTAGLIDTLCKEGLDAFRKMTKSNVIRGLNFGQRLASWSCQFEGSRGGMYQLSDSTYSQQLDQILADFRKPEASKEVVRQSPTRSPQNTSLLRFNHEAVCSVSLERGSACCL